MIKALRFGILYIALFQIGILYILTNLKSNVLRMLYVDALFSNTKSGRIRFSNGHSVKILWNLAHSTLEFAYS